jgi:hypothetical protein
MIFIRFNAGSLGHFLGSILSNQTSNFNNLDYGQGIKECFHTGAYDENDFDLVKIKLLKSDAFKVCTHNNPIFDDFIEKFRTIENKFIFIDIDSHFVEYRLNYIAKLPVYNNLLNQSAKNNWKNFEFPVICDDARRIIRLHQNKEQQIKSRTGDLKFHFGFFYYKDKVLWEGCLEYLLGELNIKNIDIHPWFENFQTTQHQVINRAEKIYDCIAKQKYINGLTDNEKGIIVGYIAQQENLDDGHSFEERHKKLSL